MFIPREIFRSYDIRGKYLDTLNNEAAYLIGRGLGSYMHKKDLKTLLVGRDSRVNSKKILPDFVKGLVESGVEVDVQEGFSTTPQVYYSLCVKDYDIGVSVTASHLSNEFAGIKISYNNAFPLHGDELIILYNMIISDDFYNASGKSKEVDFLSEYEEYLLSSFEYKNKHKVIVACGNGAASVIAPKIFKKLDIEVVEFHCDIGVDYEFVADPEDSGFIEDAKKFAEKQDAEMVIGFDGDGDRVGFIDDKNNWYHTDYIGILLSKHFLIEKPKSKIICDVKSTNLVEKFVKENGGDFEMIPTGRTNFITSVKKKEADFGFEFSGHIYYGDTFFGHDDGLYAALKMLKIVDDTKKSLSELMTEFPVLSSTSEIKITVSDDKKFQIVRTLVDKVKENRSLKDFLTIDGVRASISETGWFLIRASNTSNYLSVRVEGKDETEKNEILALVHELLETI